MQKLSIAIFFVLAASSQGTSACTIAPLPPMTVEERSTYFAQLDQQLIDRIRSADAVLEVEALTTSGPNRSKARFRVLRVLKGNTRLGSLLFLRTVGSSLCGPGEVERGQKGIIYLSKEQPKMFNGFIYKGDYDKLREAGMDP
jgi:hypothetical protein